MRNEIGKYKNKISSLKLEQRMLTLNTLILGEEGSGKTNLACKIRNFAMDSNIPTFYMDFSDSFEENVELRYKDKEFNYIQFSETEEFDKEFDKLIKEKKHIYMAVSPSYFSGKKDKKSKLSNTIAKQVLLDNYYYIFHDIENLNGFYTTFEDFLLYMLSLMNMQKYGFAFLAQPHAIFESQSLKLLFSYLFVGKCSNLNYFNTSILKTFTKNMFHFQYRKDHPTLLFNSIESNIVKVDEYILEE